MMRKSPDRRPAPTRKLLLESLERRNLMTGGAEGEFTEAQLDTIHDIEYALTGEQLINENARDTLAIQTIAEQTRQDMITYSDQWKVERAELVQDTARFDALTADHAALDAEKQRDLEAMWEKANIFFEASERYDELGAALYAVQQEWDGVSAELAPWLEEQRQVQEQARDNREIIDSFQWSLGHITNRLAD